MRPPRRVCVVTGSRADYGLLQPVMESIRASDRLELSVVATGMHLAPEFGLSVRDIETDGFRVDDRVEMPLASDTPVAIAKAIGVGTSGFADSFAELRPDLILILGDRFEILSAAQAAMVARIPIAHISGGDTTEGAIDEAIRHALTKMSHLHFVTNEPAACRVRQLGENPDNVHLVGSPGLDRLRGLELLDRDRLEADLGYRFPPRSLLVTFHPVTLDDDPAEGPFRALLEALDTFEGMGLIFTKPNADPFGGIIADLMDEFVSTRPDAVAFANLGSLRYLSTMGQVDAVVGNSSSGLLEAPSLGVPTVNVGDRQRGRPRAESVIDCPARADAIRAAIERALGMDCAHVVNPYGDGNSAARIVRIVEQEPDLRALLKKSFFDRETR